MHLLAGLLTVTTGSYTGLYWYAHLRHPCQGHLHRCQLLISRPCVKHGTKLGEALDQGIEVGSKRPLLEFARSL